MKIYSRVSVLFFIFFCCAQLLFPFAVRATQGCVCELVATQDPAISETVSAPIPQDQSACEATETVSGVAVANCQWVEQVQAEVVVPVSAPVSDPTQLLSTPLINPLTGTTNAQEIPELVGGIIQRILGILGSVALVVFMYGAFKWITSEGEAENITAGTHTMAYAAIGILVIFASYGILSSVIGGILGR